jgi:hypothetical protein
MAHYAILSDQDIVEQVITGRDEDDVDFDWEQHYSEFFKKTVKRTSFNMHQGEHAQGKPPFRLNYAGPGMRYDPALDGFVYPQPFPSWVLDPLKGIYNAPVAMPDDGKPYRWDESSLSWVESASPEVSQ